MRIQVAPPATRYTLVVGSKTVVYEERQRGRRSFAAVQAALKAVHEPSEDSDEEELSHDVSRVKDRAGLVPKSLDKIACDERLWDLFLSKYPLGKKDKYPSVEKVVTFGAWMTRNRQRACLAQRDDAGPERIGQGRHTARCILTQLKNPEEREVAGCVHVICRFAYKVIITIKNVHILVSTIAVSYTHLTLPTICSV